MNILMLRKLKPQVSEFNPKACPFVSTFPFMSVRFSDRKTRGSSLNRISKLEINSKIRCIFEFVTVQTS